MLYLLLFVKPKTDEEGDEQAAGSKNDHERLADSEIERFINASGYDEKYQRHLEVFAEWNLGVTC